MLLTKGMFSILGSDNIFCVENVNTNMTTPFLKKKLVNKILLSWILYCLMLLTKGMFSILGSDKIFCFENVNQNMTTPFLEKKKIVIKILLS